MPSPNDMVQLFSRQFGVQPRDVILDLNELRENIKDKLWCDGLDEEILSYSDRTKSCPKCGEPLEVIDQWKEPRGEMYGTETYEDMCTLGCTSCNYIKN